MSKAAGGRWKRDWIAWHRACGRRMLVLVWCWFGAHITTMRASAHGLRCETHGNKSVHASQTVPQRLVWVWLLSSRRGPTSDEAGLHNTGAHQAAGLYAARAPGCRRRQWQCQHPHPFTELAPMAGISNERLGRNSNCRSTGVKLGSWCWGKSRCAESS